MKLWKKNKNVFDCNSKNFSNIGRHLDHSLEGNSALEIGPAGANDLVCCVTFGKLPGHIGNRLYFWFFQAKKYRKDNLVIDNRRCIADERNMYWIYLIIFIIAVLVPDIIKGGFLFLSQQRLQEFAIFLLGMIGFLFFLWKEHQLAVGEKEKEKEKRKFNQTAKDLVESYSYIGEVNRKMDILMNVALGLSDRSSLDKKKEREIYKSILDASKFLMKSENSTIRFVDVKSGRTKKDVEFGEGNNLIENKKLVAMPDNINVKRYGNFLVVSSYKTIGDIRGFLIMSGYDKEEEKNFNNLEILKVLAAQALFLYSYMTRSDRMDE